MLIEELQEMLDEHGIVWHEAGDITFFGNSEYGTLYAVREYETGLSLHPLTPNKVIDIAIGEATIDDALANIADWAYDHMSDVADSYEVDDFGGSVIITDAEYEELNVLLDKAMAVETCHTVLMDCFGNPPYNTSGLNGNDIACGCSECGVPWSTSGIFRGNKLNHNFKACPLCGRRVV